MARLRFLLVVLGAVLVALVVGDCAARSRPVGSATGTTRLTVYLVRGERVAPVRRVVPRTPAVARAALAALLEGPTAQERKAGYLSCVPAGTTLHGVSVSGRVATVDFSRHFQAGGGSQSMLLRVAQVVHTATQFPTVERVAFRIDGRPVAAIGGEGVIVSPPVGRAAFEGQAPAILVEQPLPGDRVGTTLVVRGTANVFEARLVVDVRAPDGRLLARHNVSASAGTGTRGTFRVRISIPAGKRLIVVAYSRSPKDGAPINVVRVPVAR
jgi:germination protein M